MIEQAIDASVVIRAIVRGEPFGNKARQLLRDAQTQKIRLIGPPLIEYEVESDLQRRIHKRQMDIAAVNIALNKFYTAKIEIETHRDMVRRAREIARQYRQERIYDALYVALAELRGCEFWTADRALYDGVKAGLPFVNFLADYN